MQMGSPLYMAPEQLRSSRKVDSRADIWALGAVLQELVTGEPPFNAETLAELAIMTATEPAPRLASRAEQATAALQAVVDRCLEKDPERRYDSVASFAEALSASVDSDAARASARRVARVISKAERVEPASRPHSFAATLPQGPARADITARSWAKTRAASGSRRPAVLAGAVVLAAIGVVAGRAALRGDPKPATTAAAALPSTVSAQAVTPEPSSTATTSPAATAPAPSAASSASAATSASAPTSASAVTARPAPPSGAPAPAVRKPAPTARPTPTPAQKPPVEDLY